MPQDGIPTSVDHGKFQRITASAQELSGSLSDDDGFPAGQPTPIMPTPVDSAPSSSSAAQEINTLAGLASLMRSLHASSAAQLSEHAADNALAFSRLQANVGAQIQAVDERSQHAVSGVREEVVALGRRIDSRVDSLESDVKSLQDALAVAKSTVAVGPPPVSLAAGDWSRDVDGTILVVRCTKMVSKGDVSSAVLPWLSECGFDDKEFKWEGPNVGKRFCVRFNGLPVVAKKAVGHCLKRLRKQDGTYWNFEVQAADQSTCPLSVSGDKNARQIAVETSSRRLERAIKANYTHIPLFRDKISGIITSSWKDVVRVDPRPNKEETKLLWNNKAVQELGIDTNLICRKFRDTLPQREETIWEEL